MAANTYFDASAVSISDGTSADAADVNNVSNSTETGFGLLPEPDELKEGRHLVATQGGTANAITFTTGLGLSALSVFTTIQFIATTTNTGAVTATVDSIGTLAVTLNDGTALSGSEIVTGRIYTISGDGTKWILNVTDASASAAAAAASAAAAATSETNAAASAAAAAASAAVVDSERQNWIYGRSEQVGADLNITGGPTSFALSAMDDGALIGGYLVAYIDTANEDLRAYRMSFITGSTPVFALQNSELNIPTIGNPALAYQSYDSGGDAYSVAFIDSTNKDLRTYVFTNGSGWTQNGSDLNLSGLSGTPYLAALDSTAVVLTDNNKKLTTYTSTSGTFAQTGNASSAATNNPSGICSLSSTRAVVLDNTGVLQAWDWDGSDWSTQGNTEDVNATSGLSITALNNTDVLVSSVASNIAAWAVYRFDGTDWEPVSVTYGYTASGGSESEVTAINGNTIAIIDEINTDLRAYEMNIAMSSGPTRFR